MDKALKQAIFKTFDATNKNSIEVIYEPLENGTHKTHSKIGGRPSLPQGFQWPYYEGMSFDNTTANRPLAFLAEIHLSETAAYDTDGLLPAAGVLSFFYEMETEKWGFDPKDKGCARVFYFEDENVLSESEFPGDLQSDYQFPEFLLTFKQRVSLPYSVEVPAGAEDLDWDDYDQLKEEYGCRPDGWGDSTKLLGYPDVIQNPMEQECEEVTRGFYNGGEHEIPGDLEDEIQQASKDWMLLFQMGTIENGDFELMFGDCGHIYFWIKEKDLAEKNFDNVWLILQCC